MDAVSASFFGEDVQPSAEQVEWTGSAMDGRPCSAYFPRHFASQASMSFILSRARSLVASFNFLGAEMSEVPEDIDGGLAACQNNQP